MDITTLIGLVGGFAMVILGVATGTDGIGGLGHFWDIPSFAVTFGGAFFVMILQAKSLPAFVDSLKSFGIVMKVHEFNEAKVIGDIVNLSNVARKEGLLALEEMANNLEDEFLKKGIMLIVDGTDPELVRNIMETELSSLDARHNEKIGFWANLAGMGPAWGMIGTLMGLVGMLYNMDDLSSIGPNMAVAIITTFYGSLLANWICTPVSLKMTMYNDKEITVKEIMVEGLLSIQAGENPRVIEEKLKSFLAPGERDNIGAEEGGQAAAGAAAEGGEA